MYVKKNVICADLAITWGHFPFFLCARDSLQEMMKRENKRQTFLFFFFFRLHDLNEEMYGGSRGKGGGGSWLWISFSVFVLLFSVTEAYTSCVVCVLDVGPCWTWVAAQGPGSGEWVGPAHGRPGPHSFSIWPSILNRVLWADGRESGPHRLRPVWLQRSNKHVI